MKKQSVLELWTDKMFYLESKKRKAFTLIEVLISIGLLGIVLVALFSTVKTMRDSNKHLHQYLQKSKKITKSTKILYLDIANSDANLTIEKDEFSRLCIPQTKNSLYGLSMAKVCWVVIKEKNTLVRIEGNNYSLPTRLEEKVEVNKIMQHIEVFDLYHQKDKVLVFIKQKNEKPITFMLQGISKPKIKLKIKKKVTSSPKKKIITTEKIAIEKGN